MSLLPTCKTGNTGSNSITLSGAHGALPQPPLQHDTLDPLKARAAIKIQAAARGMIVRNLVIKPSQLLPALIPHVINALDARLHPELALAFCKMINTHTFQAPIKNGTGIRQPHSFTLRSDVTRREYPVTGDWWISKSQDGKYVDLLYKCKRLTFGGYKLIYRGDRIKLDLSTKRTIDVDKKVVKFTRAVERKPVVVQTLQCYKVDRSTGVDKLLDEKKSDSAINDIKNFFIDGLYFHKILLNLPGVKIVDLPVDPCNRGSTVFEDNQDENFVHEQTWYNSNLWTALQEKCIPLDVTNHPQKRPFSIDECLHVLIDVAKTLKVMHAHNIVHCDVKPENILLKIEDDGTIGGYLSDFDLTSYVGNGKNINNIQFSIWDESFKNGWLLPLTDIYSFAMMMGDLWVPNFEAIRLNPSSLNHQTIDEQHTLTIKNVINAWQKKIGHIYSVFDKCKNFGEALLVINSLLADRAGNKDELIQLKKNIILANYALSFAHTLILNSQHTYNYLIGYKYITDRLTMNASTRIPEEQARVIRAEAAEEIESDMKYTTASDLVLWLEQLKSDINAASQIG